MRGRGLGLDLGSRRIGVAVSDSEGSLAFPLALVERTSDRGKDHAEIARLAAEMSVARVVVGLPLSLDGGIGPAARSVLSEVEELRSLLDVPVEVHDERFTTVSAERALRSVGVATAIRRKRVDQTAAAMILQSWLDRKPS